VVVEEVDEFQIESEETLKDKRNRNLRFIFSLFKNVNLENLKISN